MLPIVAPLISTNRHQDILSFRVDVVGAKLILSQYIYVQMNFSCYLSLVK